MSITKNYFRRQAGLDNNFRKTYVELSSISNRIIMHLNSFIIWEWTVRPFPDNDEYTLCINYEKGWPPRVWVVVPDLSLETSIPHVFSGQNNMLCLYHHDDWLWHSSYKMKNTILVWSLMWIVYYEDFCRTGKWRGPEAEHRLSEKMFYPKTKLNSKNKQKRKLLPKFLKDYPIRRVK